MLRRLFISSALFLGLAAALASGAQARAVVQSATLGGSANAITTAADGTFWVAEPFAGQVQHISAAGTVLASYPVGANPAVIKALPNGTVWVAVTGAKQLVWFDAASAAPTAHVISTAAAASCGPFGLTASTTTVYATFPSDGACGANRIGTVALSGAGAVGLLAADPGAAHDIAFAAGRLYVPDSDGDVIRRIDVSTGAVDGIVSVPAGSLPNRIVIDGNQQVWVTLFGTGQVAQTTVGAANGAATILTPPAGTLTNPVGLAVDAGNSVWVTGRGSASIVRIDGNSGAFTTVALPAGAQPADIAFAADGTTPWVADNAAARLFAFAPTPPVVTVGAVTTTTTGARIAATIDPLSASLTSAAVDYGTTTAYGNVANFPDFTSSVKSTIFSIDALKPATTYHFRVRAQSGEGTTVSADGTFTTKPLPIVGTKVVLGAVKVLTRTKLTKLRIAPILTGTTVKVTCSSKRLGCPFASLVLRNPKGRTPSAKLDARFGLKHLLKPGVKLVITVSRPGYRSRVTTLTTRAKLKPLVASGCITPGAKLITRCS
jgi:streptogramin lyase